MTWPVYVADRYGHMIYMTAERWRHAKRHRGMNDEILPKVLSTLRESRRRQEEPFSDVFRYEKPFRGLPLGYKKIIVVVKFEFDPSNVYHENNFVMTAYLHY
ncbi:hypothetical protein HUU40_02210 [candidate division KSB1 bacterium]|nr:hypothetical protein [candidate division KSB1 bacterium]